MGDGRLQRTGSIGAYVGPTDGGQHRTNAIELERLGYDSVWLAGGQLDALGRIDEIVDATQRVRVGSGVVAFGVHEPEAIAAHHAALERTAPGRYVLGLGGPQQARPMAALAQNLDRLDRCGVRADARLLAALGPRKLALAADRAAGAITLLTSPRATAQARAALGPDPRLSVHVLTALDDDLDAARGAVAPTVGFLGQVAGYRANVRRMGFTDADLDGPSERLLDAVSALGDARAVAARITEHRASGADEVTLSIVPGRHSVLDTATAVAAQLGLA